MGSARLASIHELYLSDAPQIESACRQWSDDDLKALVPPGRSLSHVKNSWKMAMPCYFLTAPNCLCLPPNIMISACR